MSRRKRQFHIHRILALVVVCGLLFAAVPAVFAEDVTSGTCGDGLSWSFSGGTLTVSGSGAMYDFPESTMAPWYPIREKITRVILPEGLTHIGELAFYDCSRLTAVDIPDSVISIGEYAFTTCDRLALVDLGSGLTHIGTAAFYSCRSLANIRLPEGLVTVGAEAFYDCSALLSITVPASVQSVGAAAFAYCTSLVRAELKNALTFLPDWTFFGCRQLSTVILPETVSAMGNAAFRECSSLYYVSYGGDELTAEEISDTIIQDVPGFDSMGYVTDSVPNDTCGSGLVTENPDGSVTVENTQVTELENATVSSSVEILYSEEKEVVSSDITVTVENDDGWQEAMESVNGTLSQLHQDHLDSSLPQTSVTVYVKDSETVDTGFIDNLAGRNVAVNVVTEDGSSWSMDCARMDIRDPSESYDLRYSLQGAAAEICQQMSVTQGYLLRFTANAAVNAELVVRLPQELARQTATLFHQENRRTLVLHQSVVIDADGCAHFYLGEVSKDVDYFIGINVPGTQEDAIIPDSLQSEYGIDYAEPIQHVITGRESSWGIGIGTVTWILAAVMLGTVAGVGAVMYGLNRRRLKMGYIPDTSEEE